MVKKTATKKKYVPNSKEKYMCAEAQKIFYRGAAQMEKRYNKSE